MVIPISSASAPISMASAASAALAIEMGADAEDIGMTIHPHPTLSETVGMAAEDAVRFLVEQHLGQALVAPERQRAAARRPGKHALADMGADAEDIGMTIHPHPTLSETVGMAAEAFEGTITDPTMRFDSSSNSTLVRPSSRPSDSERPLAAQGNTPAT
jgi:hypothetical protein